MTLSAIIITIAAYLALLFWVAWASSKRADNQTFFTGNRRSPWWIVAWGMIGASMSGVTFVSVPGMVGWAGFSYLQMSLGFVCGYVVIALVIIPLHYRLGNISIYQYLQSRLGSGSYLTGAWMFFASKLLGAAVRIYLVCVVLQLLVFQPLGVPFAVGATVVMLLVWLYTVRGGVRSIVWTDSLRTLFLVAGVVLSIVFISRALGLDWTGMTTAIGESEFSRVWFFDDPSDGRYFFKQFFAGLFIVIAMTGLDQDMMQLPLSCRRRSDASRNFIISGVLQFVVITMFLGLGALLYLFAATRGINATGDEIFPTVAIFGGLPAVVGVVFVLGLVSSTFSSAGSALTALTTSFTVDILNFSSSPHPPKRDDDEPLEARFTDKRSAAISIDKQGATDLRFDDEIRLSRTRKLVHTALAVAMVVAILAFRALGSTSVIDAVYTLASYTYGPLLGMFAFGILTRRVVRDRWVPLVAVAAPVVCLVLDLNSAAWFGGYQFSYELLILNAGLTFGGLWALSRGTNAV